MSVRWASLADTRWATGHPPWLCRNCKQERGKHDPRTGKCPPPLGGR